jgi:Asp-tRNA(Asn)/Glu-tRNA(Gln) amidotransferase A subunit family amidase
VLLVEAATALRPYLHRRTEFGRDVLALLDQGRLISPADYIDAQRLRRIYAREFSRIWTQVDCVFTPATPIGAPKNNLPIGLHILAAPNQEDTLLRAGAALEDAMGLTSLPKLA